MKQGTAEFDVHENRKVAPPPPFFSFFLFYLIDVMNTPSPELENTPGSDDYEISVEDRPFIVTHADEEDTLQIESEEDMAHECVCTHPSHVLRDSRGRVWVDEEDEDIGSVQTSGSEESDVVD